MMFCIWLRRAVTFFVSQCLLADTEPHKSPWRPPHNCFGLELALKDRWGERPLFRKRTLSVAASNDDTWPKVDPETQVNVSATDTLLPFCYRFEPTQADSACSRRPRAGYKLLIDQDGLSGLGLGPI